MENDTTDLIAVRFDKATKISGISRTKLYELSAPGGPLETVKVGKARLIKVSSLRRLLGEVA
jgi:hypothetical protein